MQTQTTVNTTPAAPAPAKIAMTKQVLAAAIEKHQQMEAPNLPAIARELFEKTDADYGEVALVLRDGCDANLNQIARILRDEGAQAHEVAYCFYDPECLNMDGGEIAQALYFGCWLTGGETIAAIERGYLSRGRLPKGYAGAQALRSIGYEGCRLSGYEIVDALHEGLGMSAEEIVDVLHQADGVKLSADRIARALVLGLEMNAEEAEALVSGLR